MLSEMITLKCEYLQYVFFSPAGGKALRMPSEVKKGENIHEYTSLL